MSHEEILESRAKNMQEANEAVGEWLDDVCFRGMMTGRHPNQVLLDDWNEAHGKA